MPRGGPELNAADRGEMLTVARANPLAAEGHNPVQGLFVLDVKTLVLFHYWMQLGQDDSSKKGDTLISLSDWLN